MLRFFLTALILVGCTTPSNTPSIYEFNVGDKVTFSFDLEGFYRPCDNFGVIVDRDIFYLPSKETYNISYDVEVWCGSKIFLFEKNQEDLYAR